MFLKVCFSSEKLRNSKDILFSIMTGAIFHIWEPQTIKCFCPFAWEDDLANKSNWRLVLFTPAFSNKNSILGTYWYFLFEANSVEEYLVCVCMCVCVSFCH